MKKKIKLVISVCAAVLCIVIGIVIYNNLPSVVMNRRMKAFDDLHSFYVEHGPHNRLYDKYESNASYYYGLCGDLHEKCGLDSGYYEYAEYIMDDTFVESYIATHSVEEFIEKLCFIIHNCDDYCSDSYEYCIFRTGNKVLLKALEIGQIEITPFELPAEGTEGYYTEHPEEVPEDRTWEETGSFYSSTGENRHTESRPCSIKVTVHGDFLVEHYEGYSYDEGAYEWQNGEFIDRLPSFRYENEEWIEYKGKPIHEELNGAKTFCVGETVYLIYGAEECFITDHLIFPWNSLE